MIKASTTPMGITRCIAPPLLDGVAAAFQTGGRSAIIRLDQVLLLRLGVLILGRLLLAGATATSHGAHHRPGRGALARVPRHRSKRRPTRRPTCRPSRTLAATDRRPRLLRGRTRGHRRINARRLLGPRGALPLILALLLRALASGRVHDRPLCRRGTGTQEHCQGQTQLHGSSHVRRPSLHRVALVPLA